MGWRPQRPPPPPQYRSISPYVNYILVVILFSSETYGLSHIWTFYLNQRNHLSVEHQIKCNCINGVMVSVLASSAVDRGIVSRLGETKDYTIGICCFSAKHTTLRRKSKYLLVRNQDNLFERGDMSIRGLLFQWASTIQNPTRRVGLVQSGQINLFSPWYSWKIAELALSNNHSLTQIKYYSRFYMYTI